ncbi:MAG: hypothetical protein EXS51_03385 [Candidatus Taylorbacteria bacterium]|nr:hypothetical protein [Candidatus Taylorbacteria bacterium]
MKFVRLILGIALFWYLLFGMLLMVLERRMIYFPSIQNFSECPGFADAEKINYEGAWFYYKHVSSDKVVVFYHGNAGSACDRSILKDVFEQSGYSYLFLEYPGFSGDGRVPSKDAVLGDVVRVQSFLAERGLTHVVLVGESLGSGVASYHASLGGIQQVILLTPYYELADMTGILGKVYPIRYMMRENYTAGKWLRDVMKPVTVIYAEHDEIIPSGSTQKLFDALRSPGKRMVGIEGGTHNTMYEHRETFEGLKTVLTR